MDTFVWLPDAGHQEKLTPNISLARFGDGYEQRTPSGLNFIKREWPLTFTVAGTAAAEILAFLETQGGYKAFSWTTPRNETGNYICRDWTVTHQKGTIVQIQATFERVYSKE